MTWLRQLLDTDADEDPSEFLEALKVDLFEDEVFVFTPQGRGQEPLRRLDAARLRLLGPHRRRPPLRRRQGERQDRAAALHAAERRHRRDPDLEAGARPVARLAGAGAHQPRPQQDPRLAEARAPRGRRAPRPRGAADGAEEERPAAAAHRRLAAARRRDPRDGLPQGRRLLHRPRPGEDLDQDRRQQGDAAAEVGRRGRRRRDRGAARRRARGPRRAPAPHPGRLQLRDQGRGRRRRRRPAREVLPPGARRRDRRLRLARARDHDPPRGLQERRAR